MCITHLKQASSDIIIIIIIYLVYAVVFHFPRARTVMMIFCHRIFTVRLMLMYSRTYVNDFKWFYGCVLLLLVKLCNITSARTSGGFVIFPSPTAVVDPM